MSTEADGLAEPDGDMRGLLGEALAAVPGVRRYRKRPVVVEMIRWDGTLATRRRIEFHIQAGVYPKTATDNEGALHVWVAKSHGLAPLAPGDWAVIEPDGSGVYPCTAADQAATYEPADAPDPVAAERERIAGGIRDEADHLEVHVSPDPEASRNFVAGMRRAADYAVNGPNPPMANEA